MSRSVKGKINKLENCVLGPVEPGSSKLDVIGLPEAEQKLYQKAFIIADNFQKVSDYEPNATEMQIMNTVNDRLAHRVIDLFTTWMKGWLCHNDKLLEYMFSMRFWWFMEDIATFISQIYRESQIYDQKGKSWKEKEKEAEETVHKTWVSDLFTKASFERWFKEKTRGYEEYVKAKEAEP